MAKGKAKLGDAPKEMRYSQFINEVAAVVDTPKTKINVAATKRVIAVFFYMLSHQPMLVIFGVIREALQVAVKKHERGEIDC